MRHTLLCQKLSILLCFVLFTGCDDSGTPSNKGTEDTEITTQNLKSSSGNSKNHCGSYHIQIMNFKPFILSHLFGINPVLLGPFEGYKQKIESLVKSIQDKQDEINHSVPAICINPSKIHTQKDALITTFLSINDIENAKMALLENTGFPITQVATSLATPIDFSTPTFSEHEKNKMESLNTQDGIDYFRDFSNILKEKIAAQSKARETWLSFCTFNALDKYLQYATDLQEIIEDMFDFYSQEKAEYDQKNFFEFIQIYQKKKKREPACQFFLKRKDCTHSELKKAYNAEAKKYHSDRCKYNRSEEECNAEFYKIQEIWDKYAKGTPED